MPTNFPLPMHLCFIGRKNIKKNNLEQLQHSKPIRRQDKIKIQFLQRRQVVRIEATSTFIAFHDYCTALLNHTFIRVHPRPQDEKRDNAEEGSWMELQIFRPHDILPVDPAAAFWRAGQTENEPQKNLTYTDIYIYKHLYLVSLSWSIYAEKQSYPIFTSNNVLPCRPCNTKQPCSKWDIFLATSSAVEFHNSQYASYCEIWIALLICCPSTSRLQKLNVRFRCHSATENPETRTAANNCVSPVMILSSVKPHQKKGNSHSQSAIIVSNKRPLPSFTHTWLILKKVIYALFVASMRTILSQK